MSQLAAPTKFVWVRWWKMQLTDADSILCARQWVANIYIYIYIDILYAYYGKDMTNAINLWLATVLSILGQRLATCHTLLHDVRRLDARVVGGVHSNWARNATRFTQYRYCLHLPVLCIEIRSDSSFLCILYIPCIFLTDCEGFGGQNFQTCGPCWRTCGTHGTTISLLAPCHSAEAFRTHFLTHPIHRECLVLTYTVGRSVTYLPSIWTTATRTATKRMRNPWSDWNGWESKGIKKKRPNHPTLAVRIEIVEE